MRQLYYSLPFLIFATGYVFWEFKVIPAVIVLLNWLTFFMEHRYGGESKAGEELITIGILLSCSLWPGGGSLIPISEFLALFLFILELASLLIRFRTLPKIG
jgi:hypothetical protein